MVTYEGLFQLLILIVAIVVIVVFRLAHGYLTEIKLHHDVSVFTGTLRCQFTPTERRLQFQKISLWSPFSDASGAPASRCHEKGRPNRNRNVLFDVKTVL